MNMRKFVEYRFKKIVEIAEIQDDEKVLDLGCGKGEILKNFLPKVKYIGVDLVGGDINHNLEKCLPKILKKQKFDIIFLNEILEHIENFKSLLLECRQILTDNIVSQPDSYMFGHESYLNLST